MQHTGSYPATSPHTAQTSMEARGSGLPLFLLAPVSCPIPEGQDRVEEGGLLRGL